MALSPACSTPVHCTSTCCVSALLVMLVPAAAPACSAARPLMYTAISCGSSSPGLAAAQACQGGALALVAVTLLFKHRLQLLQGATGSRHHDGCVPLPVLLF